MNVESKVYVYPEVCEVNELQANLGQTPDQVLSIPGRDS
jgi:hypothetical protein